MATAIHIPLAKYLETSYRPDREYIDGEVRERNVGKREHARMQRLLAVWFGNHEKEWGIVGSVEQPGGCRNAVVPRTRRDLQPNQF